MADLSERFQVKVKLYDPPNRQDHTFSFPFEHEAEAFSLAALMAKEVRSTEKLWKRDRRAAFLAQEGK